MICRDRKIIFIHIPKCGGSSVENLLWPGARSEADLWRGFVRPGHNRYQTGGLQHLTAQLIRKAVGPATYDGCYRFALVRDPVARFVSLYNFLNKRKDLQRWLGLEGARPVAAVLDRIATPDHVQWTPQARFLTDASGALDADLFRLETMAQDFAPLARKLGLDPAHGPMALPRDNRTLPQQIPPEWQTLTRAALRPEDLRKIQHIYAEDYALLGYAPPV